MSRNAVHRVVTLLLAGLLICLVGGDAYARDLRQSGEGSRWVPKLQAWQTTSTPDGFTVWRKTIDSGCSYSDHNYTLDIPAEPANMSEISYSMSNYDVDYTDTGTCPGGPEVDIMYFNGQSLGFLSGANNSWSVNSWPLTAAQVVKGSNTIHIDTDAPGTGCWCVGVGYIEVRAKVGFKVKSHTPQSDDKNRDFHANKLDLTVTFSSEYDTGSLTSSTFLLEYRDAAGAWLPVAGGFTQLTPEQFRFTPGSNLKDGIRYRATVKGGASGVKGKDGGELSADEVWYFHTVPDLSLSDAFDYGSGSTCPPSTSPCPGVELAVFQVARNATMVPGGKEAVARLYLRWKKHADVYPTDQLTSSEFDTSITVDGATYNQRKTLERPDRYTPAQREAAAHTVNIKHTPSASFSYSAEVTPHPQTNATPVKYTQSRNLNSSGRSPRIVFDYYFLEDGAWAGGVPAADQRNSINILTAGVQLITDQFPVLGTSFNQKGPFTIGYAYTGNTLPIALCKAGPAQEVDCPGFGITSELNCVYNRLLGMRGGYKFVAATVPPTVCPGITGVALGDKVFMHQAVASANEGTIAHEVAHLYGVSKANTPTFKHRDDNTKIEGFKARTSINYSYVENVTKPFSLMDAVVRPTGTQWIDNRDYEDLVGAVTLAASLQKGGAFSASVAGSYLIVSGLIDVASGAVRLSPSFLQEVPNDPPSATGTCRVELQDGAGNVLAGDFVTPELEFVLQGLSSSHQASAITLTQGLQPFTVSLPWSDSAQKLQVSCNGTVLLTKTRSAHAPAVDFLGLSNGAFLSGTQVLNWTGSDADGNPLSYQLQLSSDGGASWSPLTPVKEGTSHSLNTAIMGSGSKMLRIMSTDGFDTTWAVRSVTFVNPLKVTSVLPTSGEVGVDLNSTVSVLFATEVNETTLSTSTFQLRDGSSQLVPGTVRYNRSSRMALFTPAAPLKPDTGYVAQLASSISDLHGNTLGAAYQWSFSTAADTKPPSVVRTSPAPGELSVPLNALVQVTFSEPVSPTTLTSSSFQLRDANGQVVTGSVTTSADGLAAIFTASGPLLPSVEYTASVAATVTDRAGNSLGTSHSWTFTTGTTSSNGLRIVGNYSDQANDLNGDKLFDNLTLFVDVEVLTSDYYNLNGRLLDKHGTLLGWQTTNTLFLSRGVHTLKLVFSSVPIRSNGVDGPYVLDALNFYNNGNPANGDVRYNVYQTYAYRVTSFYSALQLATLPDQLLEWNTTRENAFNLRDYTSHSSLPVSSVSYQIQINTDPRVGVSIDSSGNVDIRPQAGVEAESELVILARDTLNNRVTSTFHISVQKPRPSKLDVPEELTLAPQQSRQLGVQVKDQWDRLMPSPVTVTFATTVGTIDPTSVDTSTGLASTTLTAGSTTGTGFVTTRVGVLSALTRVQIQGGGGGQQTWSRTGNMGNPRALHEAVRLEDGRILTVGGWTSTAELYDPSTGTWQAAGRLSLTRRSFTLTLLRDGRVLAVGGGGGKADATAELYEPTTRTWSRTGLMAVARKDHTATLLANGKVLVVGGAGSDRSAELYDPAMGTWSRTGAMGASRSMHTATLLVDGTVLVAGGTNAAGSPLTSAELYDPATGAWRGMGEMTVARSNPTATLLANGKLLVTGGARGGLANTAELYDPAMGIWSRTGTMVQPRRYHTATLLLSGKVLVAGGFDELTGTHNAAELYDPATGIWRATASMHVKRYHHSATLMADGRVLVSGGQSDGDQASSELFDPAGF